MNNQDLNVSHSEEIKDIVAALAKTQGALKPAAFNRINPHFKNKYADFASCMDACRSPLSENGIAVVQYCSTIEGKLNLVTMLAHISGQWMKSEFPLVASKMDSQGIGSAMTYAKRYSLCGMVGIVADEDVGGDDDGEAAVGRGKFDESNRQPPRPVVQPKSPKILQGQLTTLREFESKLDSDNKGKFYAWLSSSYQIEKLQDVTVELFPRVLTTLQNGAKLTEQQKEVAHV